MSGWREEFTPKLFTLWKQGISAKQRTRDLISGVVVGIVALPLAIAFAIASGVSPEKGLITGIIAGFLISFLGGSRVQIGGPTGAFIVIVYGIVQEYGVDGLIISTFMAGFMIMVMGLARMGNYLKFIPYPLIVGFTSGIAIIIFTSQIKDALGLTMGEVPAEFIMKWPAFYAALNSVNFWSIGLAAMAILLTLYAHKAIKGVPGSLISIVLAVMIVYVFKIPVDTIGSRFGDIPNSFPKPVIPAVDFDTLRHLMGPAFAIAMLGAIESLLSAVVADGMIGGRHRSNMELVSQGVANVASAIFAGIPATGAIARTATNVRNGARTPIAGMTHAIVLLVIMIVAAPLAKLIPMATLAGILIVVAYNMGEWHTFRSLLKGHRSDVLVLLVTFFLTIVFDLVIAIEVGMVLAAFSFMKRMSDLTQTSVIIDQNNGDSLFEDELTALPKGVVLYEINGPLFFGASQKFSETLRNLQTAPRLLIIRMRHVNMIDATGLLRLKEVIAQYQARKIIILLSGVRPDVRAQLESHELTNLIGDENILPHISLALERAKVLLAQ